VDDACWPDPTLAIFRRTDGKMARAAPKKVRKQNWDNKNNACNELTASNVH
jgi:hypothetical protein